MAEAGFRFNFGSEETPREEAQEVPRAPAEEIIPSHLDGEASPESANEAFTISDGFFLLKGRVTGEQAAELLEDERVATSDLIPGVYEGGFKLWEGSVDLCQYLIGKFSLHNIFTSYEPCNELYGKSVLELGCGHGLPGIVACLGGATVHFQDYNAPVLRNLTIPALRANMARLKEGRCRPSTRFFSGDWSSVADYLTSRALGGHYDYIFTCETLYNEEAQVRLLESIKQLLQPPHGLVYVASKSYYFGVGSGIASFERLVKEDGIFEVKKVFEVGEDDKSGTVRRVILELKFPDSIMPYFL